MSSDGDSEKPETKGEQLVDEVFSWTLSDVLNENLYKDKVAEIPMTFLSVTDYTKSFVYPLFEETHADLRSKILGLNRCPTSGILCLKKTKGFTLPKPLLYTILLPRRRGSYEPEVGDLIALTNVWPRSVDDLQRPNKSYIIALVQGMKIYKFVYVIFVKSSKPIDGGEDYKKHLARQKNSKKDSKRYREKDIKHFVVYLTNLTTNIRISQALHSKLEGHKKMMIESLLQIDSSVGESVAEFSDEETCEESLLKIKEELKLLDLDSSQEAAVLSCIAAREQHYQSTLRIIWGPPGTGKTKTVGSLLIMLLGLKCRTLTCAPTNTAVLGVTKRVMSLMKNSLLYNTYGLGDIVLFGNGSRMKIDDSEDLVDVFLNNRVKILYDCLAPSSGWKGSAEWMARFLEDPEAQYRQYLTQKIEIVERKSNDNDENSNMSNEDWDKYIDGILKVEGESDLSMELDESSNEDDNEDQCRLVMKENLESDVESDINDEEADGNNEKENNDTEKQVPGKSQRILALEKSNWKALIASYLEDNKKIGDDKTGNEKSNKPLVEENILTFEEFVMKGFDTLGNHLISCIENLYTHMPTSIISNESAKQMAELVYSLKSLEASLKLRVATNVGLREALKGSDDGNNSNIHACRVLCVTIVTDLQKRLQDVKFREVHEIKKFCLSNACLLFCTASASSTALITEESKPLEFLVIDEASQLKECESLIPLQLGGLRHAVLVGDERQLPAMVQSKINEEAEFGRSLFERLVSLGHKRHLLNVQYRMHPSISQFPNKEFYNQQILDGANVKSGTYGKRFLQGSIFGSYSFINVTSAKEEFDQSHSPKNLMEVALVAEIIANLFKESIAKNQKVSVGCISPYKTQVNAIQEKLGDKYIGYENYFTVNVRSVDGFQGSEEDVIIISTVRCNPKGSVGFLSNHQRTNVALTRARYCLWILGNGSTLTNSGSIWKNLVLDAKDRGCFYNASDDKNLAKAAMIALVGLGQIDSLFNKDSLLFNKVIWQVKCSDAFLETIARFTNFEILNDVVSLVGKLASGWREDGNTEVNIEGTCMLLEEYKVTQHLRLIWTVDVVAENSACVQVLKIWDVLPPNKIKELAKILTERVYGNYTVNMLNRCKERRVDGNLMLPITWPMNSDSDQSWSLRNQLSALSLSNQTAAPSSSRSCTCCGHLSLLVVKETFQFYSRSELEDMKGGGVLDNSIDVM
ncbi:putative P-loop containing nucleoside triphosphate hydrolase [Tanacetum coccineum]